jgi:predicted MFS family arabinose efflux permease
MKNIRNVIQRVMRLYSGISKEIWLLSFITFINRSGTMVIVFMPIYLLKELHFSPVTIGQILGLYGLGNVVGSYLGGEIAQKKGATFAQLFSLVGTGIAYFALIFIRQEAFFLAAMFIAGAVVDILRPANSTAIARYTNKSSSAKAYSLNRQAVNLGNGIGPLIGGFLTSCGYQWIFVIDAITSLIAAIALVCFFGIGMTDTVCQYTKTDSTNEGLRPVSPLGNMNFVFFLVLALGIGILFFQVFTTFPVFVKDAYTISDPQYGMLQTFNAILIIFFEIYIVNKVSAFPVTRVLGTGALLMAAGLMILPYSSNYGWLYIVILLWTLGEMLTLPFMSSYIANSVNKADCGRYFGVYTAVFSSAMIFASIFGTYLMTWFGTCFFWNLLGVLGVSIFVGFEFLKRREEKCCLQLNAI